jgi:hypothetical protein
MSRSFRPQVEVLGDRLVMNAAGIAAMTSAAISPPAHAGGSPIASVTDLVLDPFNAAGAVSGRITAVAVDPTDAASAGHVDTEWRYVPVRRVALAEGPRGVDAADPDVIYVGTANGGVWASAADDSAVGARYDLSAFAGQTVRLRFAAANSQDQPGADGGEGPGDIVGRDALDPAGPAERVGPFFNFESQRLRVADGTEGA